MSKKPTKKPLGEASVRALYIPSLRTQEAFLHDMESYIVFTKTPSVATYLYNNGQLEKRTYVVGDETYAVYVKPKDEILTNKSDTANTKSLEHPSPAVRYYAKNGNLHIENTVENNDLKITWFQRIKSYISKGVPLTVAVIVLVLIAGICFQLAYNYIEYNLKNWL